MPREQIRSPSLLDEDDDHDQAGRKRRRTIQACEECRDRKRKCDGARPVCGSCSRRPPGRCMWNDHRNTKGWSNKYVESLQSRIREMEARERAMARGENANGTGNITVTAQPAEVSGRSESAEIGGLQAAGGTLFSDASLPLLGEASATPDVYEHPHAHRHSQLSLAAPISPSPSHSSSLIPKPQPPALPASLQQAPSAPSIPLASVGDDDSGSDSEDGNSNGAIGSAGFVDGLDAMGVVHSTVNNGGGEHGRRPRRPSGFFGPSSTASLWGDAFSAIKLRVPWQGPSPSPDWGGGAADHALHTENGNIFNEASSSYDAHSQYHAHDTGKASRFCYTIPTREEADRLVNSYQTWVHSLYPFLHMPSFFNRYRRLWESTGQHEARRRNSRSRDRNGGSSCGSNNSNLQASVPAIHYYDGMSDKLFHCMLNLVFAMGALFNPTIAFQDRAAVSWSFFARGKGFVDLDELACGSTALVQVLLLMGQYLQSTDAASSCWNIVGLAIRVCQGIGLHQEPDCCRNGGAEAVCTGGYHSQLEREIRRRTWTCALVLDRVLSLTYGRPMMIHPTMTANRLWLPHAIDDDYLADSASAVPGKQPGDIISTTGCYIEAVRLQEIISQFLDLINDADVGSHLPEAQTTVRTRNWYEKGYLDTKTVLDIDRLFDDWRNQLPVHLRVETYSNGQAAAAELLKQSPQRLRLLDRQANVLTARYLHARLTLLRPALSVLSRAPGEEAGYDPRISSMDKEMVIKAANLCLAATEALVELMASNMDPQADRLPAPWYNVFYIHSCAIVLLLGYLCAPSYITSTNRSSLAHSSHRCIEFLRAYRPISRSARRCYKVLGVIQRQVFDHHDDTAPSSGITNTAADFLFEFLPVEPIDLQTMIPLSDQLQPPGPLMAGGMGSARDVPYPSDLGSWVGDTNDMAWFSLVPS